MEKRYIAEFDHVSIDYEMVRLCLHAVNDVSMKLEKGKITAVVGESGSGKTTLASALLNCITSPGRVVGGRVIVHSEKRGEDIDVTALNEKQLNDFRWDIVSMVFQGAQSSLNPIVTILNQFYETYKIHGGKESKKEARKIFAKLLERVNLSERVLDSYPHEISGGMKQRVMIALALLLRPEIIILDEPTTALDVITQSYIFGLLKSINEEYGTTMLLLTHDIAVVAEYADNLGVMYGGRLMEFGTVEDVFARRFNPYTEGLINATPSLRRDADTLTEIPGTPIDITNLPPGCVFAERCLKKTERCEIVSPDDVDMGGGHMVKCHLYAEGEQDA